jgi:pyruvate formate lyase activating enzyme
MNTLTVFNVQRFSLHDGPGIRTTVFLKGCPLHCVWCHNPESIEQRPQPALAPERCLVCAECVDACAESVAGPLLPGTDQDERENCIWCGACSRVCPGEARQFLGQEMTVDEVLALAMRDVPYYESSGGGVTFSGGEPLAGPAAPLVLKCLGKLSIRGVHTAVDTCGLVDREILDQAAERADLFLFDLKLADPARHRELTGAGNQLILANLERLLRAGRRVEVRVPLVPGCTDDGPNLQGIADILLRLAGPSGPPPVRLLPYHPTATGKYARLGLNEPLAGLPAPTPEHVEHCAALLASRGLSVTTGGSHE